MAMESGEKGVERVAERGGVPERGFLGRGFEVLGVVEMRGFEG